MGLKDVKARSVSQIYSNILEKLDSCDPSAKLTKSDISLLCRESIAQSALSANQTRQELLENLDLINQVLKPLHHEIENCKEEASINSRRVGLAFTYIILA